MKTPCFSVEKTVLQRYSVRTYDPRPVEQELREKLMDFAAGLSNPFGPGIRIQFIDAAAAAKGEKLGTYGFIKGAQLYMAVTVPNEAHAAEALGYEFEHLVLYATSLGLGTCWLGGTFDRKAFASKIRIEENEVFPILSPVGYAAQKIRVSEEIFKKAFKSGGRKPWETMFFQDSFKQTLTKKAAGEYQYPLEMVRMAPSAVNKQPWRVVVSKEGIHFFLKHSPGSEVLSLDMQRIDMGIALCHFHLAVCERNLPGRFEKNCPDIKAPAGIEYMISWIFE